MPSLPDLKASDSLTSETLQRLVGPTVMLVPYARGYSPRDMLYRLWRAMEEEGLSKYVFHSWQGKATLFDQRGDLVEFIKMFEPDHGARPLVIALSADGQKLAGAIWIDDVIMGHRANLSIFMLKDYRGESALEAGLMAMDYFTTLFNLPTLWSFTPWRHAAELARKGGFQDVAILPGYVRHEGEEKAVYVLKWTKERSNE